MTAEATRGQRHACPRCKSGFIVFGGAFDGDSTCLNCGHQMFSAVKPALTLLPSELPEEETSASVERPKRRHRRNTQAAA